MQYVLSTGNVGSREVSIFYISFTYTIILIDVDCGMAWELGSCQELGPHCQGRLRWASNPAWNKSGHHWKLQDWNHPWPSSDSMGRPRGPGCSAETVGCRHLGAWTHSLERDNSVRRQVLHQPWFSDWRLLCDQQSAPPFFHSDCRAGRRHRGIHLRVNQRRGSNQVVGVLC